MGDREQHRAVREGTASHREAKVSSYEHRRYRDKFAQEGCLRYFAEVKSFQMITEYLRIDPRLKVLLRFLQRAFPLLLSRKDARLSVLEAGHQIFDDERFYFVSRVSHLILPQ